VPLAPWLLVQDWVQNAYNGISSRRRWSYLRGEGRIILSVARSGTVNVTHGSTTVTGVGLTFVAGDVDRQFRISGLPYTITDVAAGNATIDTAYAGEDSAAATGYVLDAYWNAPDDFGSFLAILDPASQTPLPNWITEDELNLTDPARTTTGTPRALVARRMGSTTAYLNRVQYEVWPYWTNEDDTYELPYFYYKRPATLSDTDEFAGPLRHRTDILVKAAIMEAATWPGTAEHPNLYARTLGLVDRLQVEVERAMTDLEREDEEVYLTWLETVNWIRHTPLAGRDERTFE